MRILLYVFGGLAALIAAIALAGAMLPRNHVATRRARFAKPAEVVFDAISGPQTWRPDLASWQQTGPSQFLETSKRGDRILFEVMENRAPERRVTRIADPSLPFGGKWTWDITPQGPASCTVRVTEDGFVSNVIFRFVSHFILGHHSTMEAYLRNLATHLQAGPDWKLEE